VRRVTEEVDADRARPGSGDRPVGRKSGLGYLPELDGLRAVAVLAVLAFHHGLGLARGGLLAVSAFFTLSGFLIASLALDEWAATGRLSFARFWERRARRLLPAALLTLAAVAVLQATLGIGSGSGGGFRLDLLSALGYATNWRLVAQGGDYAGLFSSPSPLTHFWSVAIEEQFYLAFPLAFAALMGLVQRRGPTRPGLAGLVFAGAAVASFAVAAVSAARDGNGGVAYYGTHTRAGEILVGVAMAFALAAPGVRERLTGAPTVRAIRVAGCAGLVTMAWLWHTTSLGDPHLFRGITALNALSTCAIIAAAVTGGGPTRRLLAARPLTAIGKVSYATYLFHWPLYLVLDASRVPVGYRTLFVVRLAATLAAATASYWVLEQPFRRRRVARTVPRLGLALAGGALAVAVLAVGLPVRASDDLQLASGAASGGGLDSPELRERDVVPVGPGRTAGRVLQVGDSVSWSLLGGLSGWNDRHPDQQLRADAHFAFGCPLSGPGRWKGPRGRTDTTPYCRTWLPDLPAAIERSAPSLVVMTMGLGDIGGREVGGEWRELGDPVFDRWFADRVDRVADALASGGVPVVWLTYPYVRMADRDDPTRSPDAIPLNDPARVDALNAAVRHAVAGRPGFALLDLNAWVATWPDQFDASLSDGVHFTMEGSWRVANWLVPQLLAMLDRDIHP
jgi:peptidoglycan/LPS O-acetylase OafA/YrhL